MCSSSGEPDQLYMISEWKQFMFLLFHLGLLTFCGEYATICLPLILTQTKYFNL